MCMRRYMQFRNCHSVDNNKSLSYVCILLNFQTLEDNFSCKEVPLLWGLEFSTGENALGLSVDPIVDAT